MKTFEFYRNGTVHGEVQAINLRAAKKEVFATFGRELQVYEKEKEGIKDLDITLDELYQGEKQININLNNKPFVFSVIMKDRKGVDCKLSSFGANLWMRTPKGVNMEKYKSLSSLQSAIVRTILSKVEGVEKENISFSLSDEVYTF